LPLFDRPYITSY